MIAKSLDLIVCEGVIAVVGLTGMRTLVCPFANSLPLDQRVFKYFDQWLSKGWLRKLDVTVEGYFIN